MSHPYCCNNVECLNLLGCSEVQLVKKGGSRCSRCKVARYCSRACQQQHYKLHKSLCKGLAAEEEQQQQDLQL
jgi:ATP-dependent RNA helicase DHX37/DHR1